MNPLNDIRPVRTSPLQRQSPLPGQPLPGEKFSSSEPTPPWLQKPEFKADSSGGPRPNRHLGGKIALVAAGLAAGIGGTVAVMNAAPPPQAQQLTQKQASRAVEHFQYLQKVGGTLKADPGTLVERVLHYEPEVNSQQAVDAMRQGRAIHWQPAPDIQPITVRTPEQLRDLKVKVQLHLLQHKVQQGMSNLGDLLQDFGSQIEDGIDQAFR